MGRVLGGKDLNLDQDLEPGVGFPWWLFPHMATRWQCGLWKGPFCPFSPFLADCGHLPTPMSNEAGVLFGVQIIGE